ncbi:MAG: hypothetical protein LBK04_05185 [Clostridiales Family XIII bacterium]|jgi:hypothetical protein|nr:hypothetical protein [Clostridiales Family XIII bacterium]
MPLIVLGAIVIIGALFLVLTSSKSSDERKSRLVNAPFKVKEMEDDASSKGGASKSDTPKGKVIHLYGEKKDENGE